MSKKRTKPSNLELQILGVLWELGPLPVKEIGKVIPDGKERAYTTVLTLLQVMEKKGLVSRTREGMRHIYRAKLSRDEVLKPVMSDMVSNFFGGNPARAMQFMMGDDTVSAEEIAELRQMLDDLEGK